MGRFYIGQPGGPCPRTASSRTALLADARAELWPRPNGRGCCSSTTRFARTPVWRNGAIVDTVTDDFLDEADGFGLPGGDVLGRRLARSSPRQLTPMMVVMVPTTVVAANHGGANHRRRS
jgi:hypothetical protein